MRDICIIGAGPSGLTAAIIAAEKGKKVTILERNDKCGKKLLLTGNGKCNYYNENQNIKNYNSQTTELIKKIINNNNLSKVKTFFESIGIIPKIKNGYYYPITEQSFTIHQALLSEIKKLNIEVLYNIKVDEIIKKDYFIINPKKEKIKTKKVIIATGGKSFPKTGSDGIGYDLLKQLKHKIINPNPALVKINGGGTYKGKWSGIRTDANIKLYRNDRLIEEETGQLQLTNEGISGIATFNLSTHVKKNDKILINFIPWLNESPYDFIEKMKKLNLSISDTLERFLNYKLVNIILKKSKIKTNSFKKLSKKELIKLIRNITSFEFEIDSVGNFEKAQVTKGGIPLSEINLEKMESIIVKNLYIIGEIIDIDGKCGGYNLTVAWITGIIAGENI